MKHRIDNSKTPDYIFSDLTHITPEKLKKMGAEAVAVDLDDTMLKDKSYHMPKKSREWAKSLSDKKIPIIIITNTVIIRAIILSAKLGWVPVIPLAAKPHTRGLRRAGRILGVKPEKIAMIGDRADKDVLSANRAGAISVQVESFPA